MQPVNVLSHNSYRLSIVQLKVGEDLMCCVRRRPPQIALTYLFVRAAECHVNVRVQVENHVPEVLRGAVEHVVVAVRVRVESCPQPSRASKVCKTTAWRVGQQK